MDDDLRQTLDIRLASGEIDANEHQKLLEIINKSRLAEMSEQATDGHIEEFDETSDELPGDNKNSSTSKLVWIGAALCLVAGLVLVNSIPGGGSVKSSAFRSSWNSSGTNYLGGVGGSVRSSSTDSKGNVLEFTCSGRDLVVHMYWGQSMKNIYPDASVPTATKVTARFSSGNSWDMGWTHEQDGRVSGVPKTQLGISSTIDSAIFGLLGLDGIAKKNSQMFDWHALELLQRMINEEKKSTDGLVQFVSRDTIGRNITATFKIRGLTKRVSSEMKSCVNFG